jgi:cell division septal protein FtsQ
MNLYQGRALRAEPRRARRGGMVGRVLRMLGVIAFLVLLAHLPWDAWRRRYAVVREIRIDGLHYLDATRVVAQAGIHPGDDLIALDLESARQKLLLHPRIVAARLSRSGLTDVEVTVVERSPVLLVRHGVPWEMDSTGVLLAPLADGVVADVPLLSGPELESLPAGTQIRSLEVQRGLAWARALANRDLQLSGQVSELDVSDPASTSLLMMDGTRVRTPAWPPDERRLSALRVVLADLHQRGTVAQEVDLRFEHQVIVRPAAPAATAATATGTRSS